MKPVVWGVSTLVLFSHFLFSHSGFAQQYPAKPVRTIMTIAGGADVVARLVAQGLTETLGQPFIVEAQAGAGGAVAGSGSRSSDAGKAAGAAAWGAGRAAAAWR